VARAVLNAGMHTTRLLSLTLTVGLAIGGATLLGGCREEGPAERAGERVDRSIDRMGDKIDPDGPGEEAGEKLDRALDDAKD
jgi:hypothetical protein